MSGGGGSTNTVQKSDPWEGAQPYLTGGGNGQPQTIPQYREAQGVQGEGEYIPAGYSQVPNPAYQNTGGGDGGLFGRTEAWATGGPNALTTQGQDMRLASANDPNSAINQGQNVFNSTVRGDYLNPETNPTFRSSVNDALGLARSSMGAQYGGFGGSNLMNSGYQENMGRGLGAVATNAYTNQYNIERQNQMGALAAIPAMGNLSANQIGAVGSERDADTLRRLQAANAIFTGTGGGTQSGQVPYTDNTAAQMAGLGLAAYGAFGGASAAPAAGWMTAAEIAGSSAAASDHRLKSNIKRIGTHELGIGVYEYDIFDRHEVGVMAQELMQVMPEAVVTMPSGYLGVRYDMIGGRPNG